MNKDSETASDQKDLRHRPSQLFLLRVWLGEAGRRQGPEDWDGRVQHAVTGEAHYFHGCLELDKVLRRMMPPREVDRADGIAGNDEQEDRQ